MCCWHLGGGSIAFVLGGVLCSCVPSGMRSKLWGKRSCGTEFTSFCGTCGVYTLNVLVCRQGQNLAVSYNTTSPRAGVGRSWVGAATAYYSPEAGETTEGHGYAILALPVGLLYHARFLAVSPGPAIIPPALYLQHLWLLRACLCDLWTVDLLPLQIFCTSAVLCWWVRPWPRGRRQPCRPRLCRPRALCWSLAPPALRPRNPTTASHLRLCPHPRPRGDTHPGPTSPSSCCRPPPRAPAERRGPGRGLRGQLQGAGRVSGGGRRGGHAGVRVVI